MYSFSFYSMFIINRHIHSGIRYNCDKCDKTFSQKGNLKIHYLVHTGEKPFKCDICEQSFTSNENLQSHRRTHTGDKPFKDTIHFSSEYKYFILHSFFIKGRYIRGCNRKLTAFFMYLFIFCYLSIDRGRENGLFITLVPRSFIITFSYSLAE